VLPASFDPAPASRNDDPKVQPVARLTKRLDGIRAAVSRYRLLTSSASEIEDTARHLPQLCLFSARIHSDES
jgi:hypothetical protein